MHIKNNTKYIKIKTKIRIKINNAYFSIRLKSFVVALKSLLKKSPRASDIVNMIA